MCSGLKSRTIFPTRVVFHAVCLEYFWGCFVCLFFAEEPRMVLVGGGDMVAGDPESRGTHAHFPDNNYFVHLHLSLTSERIWSGLLISPQFLQKRWQREITVERQEGINWHYSRVNHWRFLPLQPIFLWASGVQEGKESVESGWLSSRVRHWHWRTRPATMPSFPGLTLWKIPELGFEHILLFQAEVCNVRGPQSCIFQSYSIMPSFGISSLSEAHFPILLRGI